MSWSELERELKNHNNWMGLYPCKLRILLAASDIQMDTPQRVMLDYVLEHEIRLLRDDTVKSGRCEFIGYTLPVHLKYISLGEDGFPCKPLPELLRLYGEVLLVQSVR